MLGGGSVKLTMAVRFNVADDGPDAAADLEGFFDRVLEELLRLDAVEDSTISASLAKKTVTCFRASRAARSSSSDAWARRNCTHQPSIHVPSADTR